MKTVQAMKMLNVSDKKYRIEVKVRTSVVPRDAEPTLTPLPTEPRACSNMAHLVFQTWLLVLEQITYECL